MSERAGAQIMTPKDLNSNQLDNSLGINICQFASEGSSPPFEGFAHFGVLSPRLFHPAQQGSVAILPDLQHRQESLLRDVDPADPLHSFLAFLLFFEQLAFARNVTAIALG
jgi:hypothetical protein